MEFIKKTEIHFLRNLAAVRSSLAMLGGNRFLRSQVPLDPIHFEMKMQKSIPNNAKVYYVNLNLNFQPVLGHSKQHQKPVQRQ